MKLNPIRKFTHGLRTQLIINTYKNIIKPNDRVADIGCDTGFVGFHIAKALHCTVEGIDLENHLEYKIPFHGISNFKTKLPDQSFDAVMINDTLHHVSFDRQMELINEAQRISRKVLIFESQLNWAVWITDYLNEKRKMSAPNANRDLEGWQNFLPATFVFLPVKKRFWYPVGHYAFGQIPESRSKA